MSFSGRSLTKMWSGSEYGFLAPPQSGDHPHCGQLARYCASFSVKYLGSGPVQHYTDYGGCLKIMNEFSSLHQPNKKHGKLSVKQRHIKDDNEQFILAFTPQRLFVINKQTQVLEQMCKLESVYLVHPHPTRDRLFGLLTDNWMSGTLHCSCYITMDGAMGSDVLFGFRKACHIWTALSQPSSLTRNQTLSIDKITSTAATTSNEHAGPSNTPTEGIYNVQSGSYDKLASVECDLSTSEDEQPCILIPLSHTSSEVSLESVSTLEAPVTMDSKLSDLRRVSFAPTVITTESSEVVINQPSKTTNRTFRSRFLSNLLSLKRYATKNKQKSLTPKQSCIDYPRLFPRDYPPPPPPSPPHTPTCEDLIDLHSDLSDKETSNVTRRSLLNIRGASSLDASMFHTLSMDSIYRIQRCSSAPSFLLRTEWYGSFQQAVTKACSVDSLPALETLLPVLSNNSNSETSILGDFNTKQSSTDQSFNMTSSSASGSSTSQETEAFTDPSTTDTASLHRSIHQLISTSSYTIPSDLSQDSESTLALLYAIDQISSAHSSTLTTLNGTDSIRSNTESKCSVLESDTTLAKLFTEQSNGQLHSDATLAKLFREQDHKMSVGLISESESSDLTLAKLFRENDSRTSQGTQTIDQDTSKTTNNSLESVATLAKLFKDQDSQTVHSSSSTSNLSSNEASIPSTGLSSFSIATSQVIDVSSLIETLKHVVSLLASSHAILDLSLATLKEKLQSQPSNLAALCTYNGGRQDGKLSQGDSGVDSNSSESINGSKSEPVLRPTFT